MGSDPEPVSWPGSELGPSAAGLYASTCTRPIFLIFILCICMYMNMYVYAFICLIVWVWINFFPSYYTLSASVLCTCIRELVDSLCRDGADMPRPPYIGKACTRPDLEDLSLFRYLSNVYESLCTQ